ncbi:MAG: Tim44/TimA family putative adaptor protein [Pseudomonadota bacterium]|nr:Tim44/TimA family putative adaptor protein [Pseudomonadota bacterium]
MGDGFQALDIILFAMIAAFLVLRLRSVLGKKTGHQRPPTLESSTKKEEGPVSDKNLVEFPKSRKDDTDNTGAKAEAEADDPLTPALTEVKIADPNFNPSEFSEGAKGAFELVVEAYAKGDEETLRKLLNDEVFNDFSAAIKERHDAGEQLDFTLIGITAAEIIDARVEGKMAFITMQFDSEQVNITRDKDENILSGDPNQIEKISDIWIFARNTQAGDPNWTLVETRTPESL